MISGFMGFHNSNSSVGYKMKNKSYYSAKYILAKNARRNRSSIIHNWMSMLLTGICGTTAGAMVPRMNGSASVHKCKLFRRNGMTRLYTVIVTSLLYSKKNAKGAFYEGVDV